LLLDPEGDYRTLSELERVVVFGGKGERALPTAEEVDQLLRQPAAGLVLDLSAMSRSEKVAYASTVLATVAPVRSSQGLPHWLVVDEAHHVFPAEGSPAAELLRPGAESLALITLAASDLAPRVRPLANVVASTEVTSFQDAARAVLAGRDVGAAMAIADGPLDRGDAALAWLEPTPGAARFRVGRRRVQHRRHLRKYTEGELPPDRSFFFRGPTASLNLRAANLVRFVELAEGVDEATWAFHLTRGDYSAWLRDMIKDPELADEIGAVERAGLPAAGSRARILSALRQRYAV
jgi:hypothetical protein